MILAELTDKEVFLLLALLATEKMRFEEDEDSFEAQNCQQLMDKLTEAL